MADRPGRQIGRDSSRLMMWLIGMVAVVLAGCGIQDWRHRSVHISLIALLMLAAVLMLFIVDAFDVLSSVGSMVVVLLSTTVYIALCFKFFFRQDLRAGRHSSAAVTYSYC